ncbi:hypothetical protein CEUSTIGMA_g2093.t1 [Chlamydomonas eustigma]|uniref:BAT2 N-terminal domain-containing protein n=1 Tax=Chlamydomonas eustigma TaxID=1157962 RepID=A0A250WV20_9CHLO|nr:hypothetical protein CEUSTIGMA_g2093.t1 [Chlamydomonas eustigma]|eukprot:GAX74645.1 hypothetical protein CEUSTIGMA_g2093.t1 [Chlamydomonas eustigma]
MSLPQQKNSQAKYANLNLNASLTSKSGLGVGATGSGLAQGASTLTKGGLLVLSKRPRAATGSKLSVPKPVNLPSIKKEHAGNDPSTQLVPASSGSGTWTKPEDVPPETTPSLTSSSTWATSQPQKASQSAGPWQPPVAATSSVPTFRGLSDRLLNPEEYPSLAASLKAEAAGFARQGKTVHDHEDARWADDERAGSGAWRAPDWSNKGDKFDDERFVGDRPVGGWDYPSGDRRYEYDGSFGQSRTVYDDDAREGRGKGGYSALGGGYDQGYSPSLFGHRRGSFGDQLPPPPPPPPRRPGTHGIDGGYHSGNNDLYDDRGLLPPPPPPRGSQMENVDDEDDPERRAFQAELRRVAADLERRKNAERSDSVAEKRSMTLTDSGDAAPSQGESSAASDSEHGPRPVKARQVIRDLAEDEEERRRRERAGEKLKQLEQQMASRKGAPGEAESESSWVVKPPAGPWKKLTRNEDLAWDDDSLGLGNQDDVPVQHPVSSSAPSKSSNGPATGLDPKLVTQPPPPPPPPRTVAPQILQHPSQPGHDTRPPSHPLQQPKSAQVHIHPQQHNSFTQQQHNSFTQQQQQPPVLLQHAPPQGSASIEASAQSTSGALFGSFDDGLLEELSRASPALRGLGHQEPESIKPKLWRPADGITPVLLTHAASPRQQQQPALDLSQQQQQQPALDLSQQQLQQLHNPVPANSPPVDNNGANQGSSVRVQETTPAMVRPERSRRGEGRGGRGVGRISNGVGGVRHPGGEEGAPNAASEGSNSSVRGATSARGRGRVRPQSAADCEDMDSSEAASWNGNQHGNVHPSGRGGGRGRGRGPTSHMVTGDSCLPTPASSGGAASSAASWLAPSHPPARPGSSGPSLADPVVVFDRHQPGSRAGRQGPAASQASPATEVPGAPLVAASQASPATEVPGAPLVAAGGVQQQQQVQPGPPLDNSVLALPADLSLDVVPVQPRLGSNLKAFAAPALPSGDQPNRLVGGPFGFGAGALASPVPPRATPTGLAAMWNDPIKGGAAGPAGVQGRGAAGQGVPGMRVPGPVAASWAGAPGHHPATAAAAATFAQPGSQILFGSSFGGSFSGPAPPQRPYPSGAPGVATSAGGAITASSGNNTWMVQPAAGQQPFLPSNKPPDWSTGSGASLVGMTAPSTTPQPLSGLGIPVPTFPPTGEPLSNGPAIPNGVARAFANPMAGPSAFPVMPGGFSAAPGGQQPSNRNQMGSQAVPPQPGRPSPQGHHPHLKAQQHQRVNPNTPAAATNAALANLPDDIFDSKPAAKPASSRPNSRSSQPPAAAAQAPPHVAANGAVSGNGERNAGGRGRGGRGRGGKGASDVEKGNESVPREAGGTGRGFSGRNGRGAGRSTTAAAAVAAAAAAAAAAASGMTSTPPAASLITVNSEANASTAAMTADGVKSQPSEGGRHGSGGRGRGRGGRGGPGQSARTGRGGSKLTGTSSGAAPAANSTEQGAPVVPQE